MNNNLCLFCGNAGHSARDCRKAANTTKARRATATAATDSPGQSGN